MLRGVEANARATAELVALTTSMQQRIGTLSASGDTLAGGTFEALPAANTTLRSVSLVAGSDDTPLEVTDYLTELLWAREECKDTLRMLKADKTKPSSIAKIQCIEQIRKLSGDIEREREKRDKGGYVSKEELVGVIQKVTLALQGYPEARAAVEEAMK